LGIFFGWCVGESATLDASPGRSNPGFCHPHNIENNYSYKSYKILFQKARQALKNKAFQAFKKISKKSLHFQNSLRI